MNIELLSLDQAIAQFNFFVAFGLIVFYLFAEALDSSLHYSLNHHKSYRSALITFVLYIVLAIEVVAFVSNYLYALPIAFGAAIGSFWIVEREKKKHPLKD